MINYYVVGGLGIAAALAGIPLAALAYETPETGSIRLAGRWWLGGQVPPLLMAAASLMTTGGATIIVAVVPMGLAMPAYWTFAVFGAGSALIDLCSRRLPFLLTGVMGVASVTCFTVDALKTGSSSHLTRATIATVSIALFLFVLALILPGQLGLGDVAFASLIAFNLGWQSIQTAANGLLAGFLLQAAISIVAKRPGLNNASTPMGPALFVGCLLAVMTTA